MGNLLLPILISNTSQGSTFRVTMQCWVTVTNLLGVRTPLDCGACSAGCCAAVIQSIRVCSGGSASSEGRCCLQKSLGPQNSCNRPILFAPSTQQNYTFLISQPGSGHTCGLCCVAAGRAVISKGNCVAAFNSSSPGAGAGGANLLSGSRTPARNVHTSYGLRKMLNGPHAGSLHRCIELYA